MVISQTIKNLAISWVSSGDAESPEAINNGLCADFASSIADTLCGVKIVGVYDTDDLYRILGGFSKEFELAVSNNLVGHTCVYKDGIYYDSECPDGVFRFELLPINQRALTY